MLLFFVFGLFIINSRALDYPEFPRTFEESNEVLSQFADDIARHFEQEYMQYQISGNESEKLQQLTLQLSELHSGQRQLFINNIADLNSANQFFICTTCRATVNVIIRMYRQPNGPLNGPNSEHYSKQIVLDLCRRLDIQTDEVCGAVFDFNWPILDFIIQNSIADSRSMCGSLPIRFCQVTQSEFEWSLKIDGSALPITGPKSDKPQKSANDLSVLHLTDIHYDPLYEPGALAECDEILCCQRDRVLVEGTPQAAGYWSDYRVCDSPWHMITDALEHIKRTHLKIDYIYHTGDIVDHMIWKTSKEKNSADLTKIYDLLEEMFPGIPVYSCVGNHEPHPLNVFGPLDVPEHINVQWLYVHLNSLWSKWLPSHTEDTILAGGYYTVSPKPGFRIISVNNNDCYIFNWWIYYNGSRVQTQLVWLHDTLLAAELAGEYVHILAHIPSGDGDCWPVWSREFNRLIERFHRIISGIFNGHTHKDEMNVHYGAESGHAIGISWNGGSLTSYTYKNPNYRIYEVEAQTMQVVDHETWIFNITEANSMGSERSPLWYKEYMFSEEFTDDLSPAGIDALLNQMADNPDLVRKYWRYKITSADPRLETGCDNKCLKKVICRLATTVYNQKERCRELSDKLQIALDNESPSTTTKKPDGDDSGRASGLYSMKLCTFIVMILLLKCLFN